MFRMRESVRFGIVLVVSLGGLVLAQWSSSVAVG